MRNFSSADEVEEFIGKANKVADALAKYGITFSYHNHSGEFIRFENGKTAFDMLIEVLTSENAYFMPDTCWIQHGGADVRHFIERLAGRIRTLHLKDMKKRRITLDLPRSDKEIFGGMAS